MTSILSKTTTFTARNTDDLISLYIEHNICDIMFNRRTSQI